MSEAQAIDDADRALSSPISGLEFLIGAAIVLGHNVWHVLPNEVPILFVLGLVSTRLREGGWAALGLKRPKSWPKTILLAAGATILRLLLGTLVIDPLTAHFLEKVHFDPDALDSTTPPACGHVRQNQKLARTTHRRSAPDRRIALARRAAALCPCARLGASDQATLRVLATLFLESKSLEPTKGCSLTTPTLSCSRPMLAYPS
jgi:hypothetical protein